MPEALQIVEASEVVGMDERPKDAVRRKKNSSMRVAVNLVRTEPPPPASAPATRAHCSRPPASCSAWCRESTVRRSSHRFPSAHGHTVMLDLGANPDCTAEHLVEFALMGSVLAQRSARACERPRVGLLNIGEEDIKGTEELREAHRRLARGADQLLRLRRGRRHFLRGRRRRRDRWLHRQRRAEDERRPGALHHRA